MTTMTHTPTRGPEQVLSEVRKGRMTRFQIVTVTIALLLVVLDGFEVGIMAFAAPQIQQEMGIGPDVLGYVLSASLFGMAAGSIVLTPPTLRLTLALWIGYGLLVASYYFANTWIPTILTQVSGDPQLGTTMGIGANLGGVLGCFLFAGLAVRFSGRRLLFLTLFAAAAAYLLFGLIFSIVPVAIAVGFVLGVLTTAAIAGFYAVAPTVYTFQARATGIGWMIGLGRLVSVAAPIIVGYVLATGIAPERVFIAFAIPLAIAGLAALSLLVGRTATDMAD